MKKRNENNKKLSVILISGFIVLSMILSIFAIVVDNQSSTLPDYNGKSFTLTNNGYKTKIDGKYMEFYYYPADLERINMSKDISQKIKTMSGLGIVFDPYDNTSDNLAYIDVIRYDLAMQIDKPMFVGITNASSNYSSISVVNCSMASPGFPLLLIDTKVNYTSNSQVFSVSKENPDCIIMNAKLRDILAAKDRIVYTYYGIME